MLYFYYGDIMNIKDNNFNTDIDDNNSGDNRGKFSDRIKKIRRDRLMWKKKGVLTEEDESIIKTGARNVFKIALALPSVIYTNIKSSNKFNKSTSTVDQLGNNFDERKIKVNKIKDINVALLKKKKEIYLRDLQTSGIVIDDDILAQVENQSRIEELQNEILKLIRKRLVKNINELEVLQSELYILKELDGDSVYLKKCEENVKEIRKLLSKIKTLKEKYDNLKDNFDFEYMLEYGDDYLIDKILELKDLCSRDDIKYIVDNYKILDEYKYLYLKIDKLQEETIKLEEVRDKKVEDLKKRDVDFEKLKERIFDSQKESDRYEIFVRDQQAFLTSLEDKISRIDSYERVTYKLKGFNQLLSNSFKYLGLLLISPLKGLVPSIATQTLITRNIIHNLRDNLELEEHRKMIYEGIDYSTELEKAINNLDITSTLIDSTLEDVVRLKAEYKNQFSKYEAEMPGYKDAIKKINKIENAILGSKIKLDLTKQRMLEKERQNEMKMKKIKKLNSSTNS